MTDSNLQTTDMEQWEEIAEAMNDLDEAKNRVFCLLSGDVPKTVWSDNYQQMSDAETKLKSELEDRMFKEHPNDSDTHIFYGRD